MAKKLNLRDSKLAFWKPNCQAMFPPEDKNLSEMIHMRREIFGEDKDLIRVDEAEWKITQNLIHNVLPAFLRPKDMQWNSNIPKGVMMAVFWTSPGETSN